MPIGSELVGLMAASSGGAQIKMYMMGGVDSIGSGYENTDCRIWDESANTWSSGATLAQGRAGNANNNGALWVQGAAYRNSRFTQAYGFSTGTASVAIGYDYDVAANTSATNTTGPGPNGAISTYWSMHDEMYVCGRQFYDGYGWDRYNYVSSQAYSDDSWTARGTSPQNCYNDSFTACFSSETNIAHILGGRNGPTGDRTAWGSYITNSYDYSQSADSWTGANALPAAAGGPASNWIDNTNEKTYTWCDGNVGNEILSIWTKSTDAWSTGTSSTPRVRENSCMAMNESSGIGYYSSGQAKAPESPTGYVNTGGNYTMGTNAWATGVPADCGVGQPAGGFGFFGGIEQ